MEALEDVVPLLQGACIERDDRLALAREHGGDALADFCVGPIVDQQGEVRVAQQVDEPWGDDPARDVDAVPGRRPREITHRDDALAPDAHIGAKAGGTGPVDDLAVLQDEVE
ncbi:MAG TPA: hypothetical protein VMT11_04600 [Myxococcaceae bacterium]|nr:hypothetical protein [Myxococcaceae bacterium]